jgi:hypothetical protein
MPVLSSFASLIACASQGAIEEDMLAMDLKAEKEEDGDDFRQL